MLIDIVLCYWSTACYLLKKNKSYMYQHFRASPLAIQGESVVVYSYTKRYVTIYICANVYARTHIGNCLCKSFSVVYKINIQISFWIHKFNLFVQILFTHSNIWIQCLLNLKSIDRITKATFDTVTKWSKAIKIIQVINETYPLSIAMT